MTSFSWRLPPEVAIETSSEGALRFFDSARETGMIWASHGVEGSHYCCKKLGLVIVAASASSNPTSRRFLGCCQAVADLRLGFTPLATRFSNHIISAFLHPPHPGNPYRELTITKLALAAILDKGQCFHRGRLPLWLLFLLTENENPG
jgi:hypothetical protein